LESSKEQLQQEFKNGIFSAFSTHSITGNKKLVEISE
jgi:hypothetical protein